jgi:sulfatase maturation enzyme AslB (radical SAM superfamily)
MPWMYTDTLEKHWNGPEFKKLRKAFMNGEKPPECEWCWREEDMGIKSYREDLILKRQTQHITKDTVTEEADAPTSFDLKLSNVCNLKCRMCGPMASSMIKKEEDKIRPQPLDPKDYWLANKIMGTNNQEVLDKWLPEILNIELTGGEPLVSPENKQLLKYIAASGWASNISLLITTNVTIYNKDVVNDLLKFREIRITASIDDIGNRLQYARGGARWETILANAIKYSELSKKYKKLTFNLMPTVNNYNIWYLQDIIDFYHDIGADDLLFNMVHEPVNQSVQYLPEDVKEKIKEKYRGNNNYQLQKVVSFLDASDEDKLGDFMSITSQLDKRRKESFDEVFPEFAEVLFG